ncbi:MAG: hypothetical protein Q9180_009099, partial [Flavoplaca navasiana]
MSMLPAPERNASARAVPDFRQNQKVAAETQTVPNRSSKSHPQVKSPSEDPMALILPPGPVQQSKVAPNAKMMTPRRRLPDERRKTRGRTVRDPDYTPTPMPRQGKPKPDDRLHQDPQHQPRTPRGDPLEEVPTRSGAHSRLNRFSQDPRQPVQNTTYLASGPPAPTSSSVVLATAKTSLPVAREHSIPPFHFGSSGLTQSSADFLSPKSLVDNATYTHVVSALNGTTASHRNTTPKGNSPAHQPVREQSSLAESHKSSPKHMNREQSAAAGSHQSILDQAEREQSATNGSHRPIPNQAQCVELPGSELQYASSASSPQVHGQ